MAGDIWEQAVETYLAIDRGLFLNPEYLVGTPGEWEGYPDFLAICFPEKTAWMVEVTRAAKGLSRKISEFSKDYSSRIQEQLVRHQVIPPGDTDWKCGFWAFVPKQDCEDVRSRLRNANVQYSEVTALEETLDPTAWNRRFR